MSDRKFFWSFAMLGGSITAALAYFFGAPLVSIALAFEKPFNMPSASMEPTLREGERFLVETDIKAELRRGDLIVVTAHTGGQSAKYVKRLAAFGGETVELRDGKVIIDDKSVLQNEIGIEKSSEYGREIQRVRLSEQFPDEREAHQIYDKGPSSGDDFGPIMIPAGHLFLLGDNRDNSADSRFDDKVAGVGIGMVPTNKVVGRVTKIYWSSDSKRIGMVVH